MAWPVEVEAVAAAVAAVALVLVWMLASVSPLWVREEELAVVAEVLDEEE